MAHKISTKIFKINQAHFERLSAFYFIDQLVENHNRNSSTQTQYKEVACVKQGDQFDQRLFVHNPKEKPPSWQKLLLEITDKHGDIKYIKSRYPSFVLFFFLDKEVYAITGGAGYRLIEESIDSQFGFNVVERLIDTSQSDMRRISERVFLGVELASNRFFRPDYVFEDEDTFGKYYRGLDVFIKKEKLLEIGVNTDKKELLVRGEAGFKIDTKITFEQLIERIEKLSSILKKKNLGIELNPFKKLTRGELKIRIGTKTTKEKLEQELAIKYFELFNNNDDLYEIYHPNLIEYLNCSEIRLKYEKTVEHISTAQRITPRLIIGKALGHIDSIRMPMFRKLAKEIKLSIYDESTEKYLYEVCFADCFFGEVLVNDKKYLKFENDWFHYTLQFSSDLNQRLESMRERVNIETMSKWNLLIDEGDYNDLHGKQHNTLVADQKFHKRIEIADIISWTKEELKIYHVKKGLNRDLRILQSQVINSAKVIAEFRANINSKSVEDYHNKLKDQPDSFSGDFPSLEEFKKILMRNNVRFVFAFATSSKNTTKSEIFDEITNSNSAIAKISILHTFYTIRQMDFEFSLAKIIKY